MWRLFPKVDNICALFPINKIDIGGSCLGSARIRGCPKDSQHKITKKTKASCHLYSLRFLGFLLFITSVPSASSAVRFSVATEPRRVIRA